MFGPSLVEDDRRRGERLLVAVLDDGNFADDEVEDVRRLGVLVGGEFGALPEAERLDEHVVGDREFLGDDLAVVGSKLWVTIERHGRHDGTRALRLCPCAAGGGRPRTLARRRPDGGTGGDLRVGPFGRGMVTRLAEGVWWFDLRGVNAFLVDDDGILTLVDAGTPLDAADIADGVARTGHRLADVDRVLLTHYDLDHVGGLAGLKRRGLDAPVVAGEADARLLTGEDRPDLWPHKGILQRVLGRFVPEVDLAVGPVADGERVGSFTAFHTPGHTPGHTVYVSDARSTALLGDLVVERRGRLGPSNRLLSYDVGAVRRSVTSLARYAPDFDVAAVGHGVPFVREGDDRLAEAADAL